MGLGADGTRYFAAVPADPERGTVDHYYAVDARTDKLLETLTGLPKGLRSFGGNTEGSALLGETLLADGKSKIIRDQAGGRIARVPLSP